MIRYGNTGNRVFKRGLKNLIGTLKLLNFENWCNGEVSKIRHRFRKGSDLEIDILYPPLENSTTRTTTMLQKHE